MFLLDVHTFLAITTTHTEEENVNIWQIDFSAIQEEFRKLGTILIAGGIAGRAFDHKIYTLAAVCAILGGMALIALGVIRRSETKKEGTDNV